jgi:hypothetical protein
MKALRSGNTSLTELNVGSCGISLATQRFAASSRAKFARSSASFQLLTFLFYRVLLAKISENRDSMVVKSQAKWVPGSLGARPPAPPVKPPWQVVPTLTHLPAPGALCVFPHFPFKTAVGYVSTCLNL